ncbi:MAG: hypothetical protein QOJ07_2060 [Thermoleophilaceae bacterium]|nr:hypothetical protein [Thermoleophilaceae bacterium]
MKRIATLLVALAAVAAAPAHAHDSESPPGAPHNWLPREPWVMEHWLPYDESRLEALLHTDTPGLLHWLANDHHTLRQLARKRGVDPRTLAARLVAPRRGDVSPATYRVLLSRAGRTLTQGHLAQHVLFHAFHGPDVKHDAEHVFGVSRTRFVALRQRGLSPVQIAAKGHRTEHSVRHHVLHELMSEASAGRRGGSESASQSLVMLARQKKLLGCWMTTPLAKFDRDNPYGDPYGGHGPHSRGSRVGVIHPKPPRGCWKLLLET